jgi:hypothetical protein
MWAAILTGLGLGAAAIGAAWWLAVGPFDLRWYASAWLLGALPLALINPSLGLLLAAGQPTHRRALLVGISVSVAGLILLAPGFLTLNSAWSWVNPGRPVFFLYFLVNWARLDPAANPLDALLSRWLTPGALRGSIVAGLAQVGVGWGLVWAWMRKREA